MGEDEDVNDTPVLPLFSCFSMVIVYVLFFSFVSFLSLIMKRAYLGLVLVQLRIIELFLLCHCYSYDHIFFRTEEPPGLDGIGARSHATSIQAA